MKRVICVFLAMLLLCGCTGNFGDVGLKDSMAIPENGIIEKAVVQQIKDENAVAVFYGESNGVKYEWKLFAKDIEEAKDVNLSVDLQNSGEEVTAVFAQKESLGFSAMLSIYLKDKWEYLSASAWQDGTKVYSVSLTGTTKESTLNLFVEDILGTLTIRPDSPKDPTLTEPTAPKPTTPGTTTPRPTIPEPTNPEPTSPKPTTPEPTIPKPTIPAFTTPEPTSPKPTEPKPTESKPNPTKPDPTEPTKDKYETDPIPEGRPKPVEPEDTEIDKTKKYTCTFSIECSTIFNNLPNLKPEKMELLPTNGYVLKPIQVEFYAGESVFDVLQRVCKDNKIHLEFSWIPIYNTAYIEGIANLYEFDCGDLSGWMYRVDGWYPNYGCSRYQLADGDVVEWRYTCDLGQDVGDNWMGST